MSDEPTDDDERASTRADLLPEERVAGSEDPGGQAEAILAESDERIETSDSPRSDPERRTSEDTTPPA